MKLLVLFLGFIILPLALVGQDVNWPRLRESSHFMVKDPFKNHWFANKKYDTMRNCIDTSLFYVRFITTLKCKERDSSIKDQFAIIKYFSDGVVYGKGFEFNRVYSIDDLANGQLSMCACFPCYDNLILVEIFGLKSTIDYSREFMWGSLGSEFIIFHAYGIRTKLFSKEISPDVKNAEPSSICTIDFKETKPIPKRFIMRDIRKGLESVE